MHILKTIDIEKIFPNGTHALKKINLKVIEGEFTVIVGSSGSGKSTLLKCLNHTFIPTSGQVLFRNINIGNVTGNELRKIHRKMGVIFQQFNLIKRYKVLTNVLTGALGRHNSIKSIIGIWPQELKIQALEKLDIVGIREKAFSRVDALSGGQQQRVAIARALMQNPEIIFADEPVASLDPFTAEIIMNYLKEINQKYKITIICTLHSVELAIKYGTRILALNHGNISFEGNAWEFQNTPTDIIYKNVIY